FKPELLHASGAALLHQEMGKAYPRMSWISNALRLGCATMFTLFFGGDEYAPGIQVEGESVQSYLQNRYLAAMRAIAARVARLPAVIGFGCMNEPSSGWIGVDDLARPTNLPLVIGAVPSPWAAIRAGSGFPAEAEVKAIRALDLRTVDRVVLGSPGLSVWDEEKGCVWRRAGLWELEGGVPALRDPRALATRRGGGKVDFCADFLKPFVLRFAREIRLAAEGARRFAIFIEGVPNAARPTWGPEDPGPAVDASHWYDDFTLVMKRWTGFVAVDSRSAKVFLGPRRVRRYFIRALAELREWSEKKMSGIPTLLGEFGLPFDLNRRIAYRRGDYSIHEEALSAYYDAVDANLLDSTLWNYSALNVAERGDLWNDEDLSVFSADLAAAGR
ncbi:MAG: cytoplasm protein, partial [Spirochaetaceae bacterium]|nr:cytoplasm protein [Spirochaetaceae bacterium]